MIRKSGREHINYPREDVFDAGTRKINWPRDCDGLELQPEDEQVEIGSRLIVGLKLSKFAIHLNGSVTVCSPEEGVVITGEDSKASARIEFILNDNDELGGTDIDYALDIAGKKFLIRQAEPLVRSYLDHTVPQFTTDYVNNINTYLGSTQNSA